MTVVMIMMMMKESYEEISVITKLQVIASPAQGMYDAAINSISINNIAIHIKPAMLISLRQSHHTNPSLPYLSNNKASTNYISPILIRNSQSKRYLKQMQGYAF